MPSPETRWRAIAVRAPFILVAALLALAFTATVTAAQSCKDCVVYAVTELNLRQGPALDAEVLRFVPGGAAVERRSGAETNGYAPVTYDSVPGWVVALGLVATPEEVDPASGAGASVPPASASAPTTASNDRVTLAPLLLRGGPSNDAEPILTMPEGSIVTLTREGAENTYVTVDYGGVTGWAYADLLGETA